MPKRSTQNTRRKLAQKHEHKTAKYYKKQQTNNVHSYKLKLVSDYVIYYLLTVLYKGIHTK